MLASLFACNKDKKDEPQGAKIESISFKQENNSVFEYQAEGINLRDELTIAPTAMADTCKVTWALTNTDVASISKDGVITPNKVGETLVTATVQNKSAQCKFTVKEVVVTKIILEDLEVAVGAEAALVYTTEPAMVPVDRLTLTSADVNVAKISESNAVIGVKDGETTITAKCGTVQATCNVKVGKGVIPVKSVKVLPASFADDVIVGATKKLEIEVDPVDAQYDKVIWRTSNSSVATVSEDGTVTCKGKGSCTITATVDGKEGTCQVTYTESIVHVTSVTVTPSTWTTNVTIGLTKKLTATVLPDNATEKTVTWTSSNNSIASVASDGTVTCKGVGEATITASCDGKSGTCKVTFKKVPVTSVSVDPASFTGDAIVGSTKKLKANIFPNNATEQTVVWASSNNSVAIVSSDGTVTCKGVGTATISATCDGKSGTCKVTYNKIKVTSVIVNPSVFTMEGNVGSTKQLTVIIQPSNASEKTISLKSSNTSVATVSSTGLVTCKGVGDATITATCDGVSGTCTAHFTQPVIKVQSVTMSQTSANLLSVATAGGEGIGILSLDATVKPSNATYPTLTWKSSNTSVASVDGYGVVIAYGAGTTTITATADGKSATCEITVRPGAYILDRENNSYLTVKIGNQWWFAENLRCGRYDTNSERPNAGISSSPTADGDDPYYLDTRITSNWEDATHAGYLSAAQKKKLGYMYNWAAAVGFRTGSEARESTSLTGRQGICPNGWHIPTLAEWNTLISNVGGEEVAGTKLKTTSGWYTTSSSFNSNGTDEFFFGILPSGSGSSGKIKKIGEYAEFWTSSVNVYNTEYATYEEFCWGYGYSVDRESGKHILLAVRCVK